MLKRKLVLTLTFAALAVPYWAAAAQSNTPPPAATPQVVTGTQSRTPGNGDNPFVNYPFAIRCCHWHHTAAA